MVTRWNQGVVVWEARVNKGDQDINKGQGGTSVKIYSRERRGTKAKVIY